MDLIFQFLRIMVFCFAGELCYNFLPLPIPASVYGLLLLLAALKLGWVKLEQVRTAALFLIGISSIALIIRGYKDRAKEEKPYFPKGGVLKVTKSFLMLVLYAVAMTYLGFVITTPFATAAFIYDLKGNSEVKPVSTAIISVVVTAALYAMFVFAFQIKLPAGVLFGG